jgi:hypothetical protein
MKGKTILSIPISSANPFFAILREAFDLLYEEGQEKPKMMNASGKPDMWVCKREDNARRWLNEHSCETAS